LIHVDDLGGWAIIKSKGFDRNKFGPFDASSTVGVVNSLIEF
jgi:hypothetical protein